MPLDFYPDTALLGVITKHGNRPDNAPQRIRPACIMANEVTAQSISRFQHLLFEPLQGGGVKHHHVIHRGNSIKLFPQRLQARVGDVSGCRPRHSPRYRDKRSSGRAGMAFRVSRTSNTDGPRLVSSKHTHTRIAGSTTKEAREQPFRFLLLFWTLPLKHLLLLLNTSKQALWDDPIFRDFLNLPLVAGVRARHTLPGVRVFDHTDAVPDQYAVIKWIAENTVSALGTAIDRGVFDDGALIGFAHYDRGGSINSTFRRPISVVELEMLPL